MEGVPTFQNIWTCFYTVKGKIRSLLKSYRPFSFYCEYSEKSAMNALRLPEDGNIGTGILDLLITYFFYALYSMDSSGWILLLLNLLK